MERTFTEIFIPSDGALSPSPSQFIPFTGILRTERSDLFPTITFLFSDGNSKRTFCYISDAIIGYLKILANGSRGHSYNIGNIKPEITIKQLAMKMKKISKDVCNYKGKVIFLQTNWAEALYIKEK